MDRLPALIAIVGLALAPACDQKGEEPPAGSRADVGKAGARPRASAEGFCDKIYASPEQAPAFLLPPLATGTAPAAPAGHWRWVNVWATWCKPCVEEMPRLERWRQQLARAGKKLDVVYLSVDENDEVTAKFHAAHPDIPKGVRAEAKAVPAWFQSLGLDAQAPIPVHIWVDPSGRTRCIRAGGVREPDYATVEKLLGG